MSKLIRVIALPVMLELANVAAHSAIRNDVVGVEWIDVVGMAITMGIMVLLGWRIANAYSNPYLLTVLGAVVVWGVSAAVISIALRGGETSVFGGYILSAFFIVPIAVTFAVVGCSLSKRYSRRA